ncbi:hypothetical protein KAR91_32505 [Candidatus Pacearchaeota archaeon]|nr:hypothetical protein [Candidatus Pacearchaeota archaeon]
MDKVRVKFFKQSFKVTHPVITPMTLFLKRDIDERDKIQIKAFVIVLIDQSIQLGREMAQKEMRVAIGMNERLD